LGQSFAKPTATTSFDLTLDISQTSLFKLMVPSGSSQQDVFQMQLSEDEETFSLTWNNAISDDNI
jgi:hypothetical protein